jgi:hypothetical protein
VLCVGLASFSVLRAAEWLTVLSIMLGVVVLTTALTDARGFLSVVAGLASWPLAAVRGLPLLGRTVAATSRINVVWPVVRTAAISLVALVVFGGLFASGDAVFGSWAQAIVPNFAWDGLTFRFFVGFVLGGALLAAGYVAHNPPRVDRVALPAGRPVARLWEWVVPVGLVVALFAAFVVAQAAALFGGHDYVQRTTGLTYAEYVHQGFGQLTAATVLTLATVALVSAVAIVLVGGLANPEAWVAQRNIDRYQATGRLDAAYLRTLGADATPAIVAGLPREVSACIVLPSSIAARAAREDVLSWNLGRSREASLGVAPMTPAEAARCPGLMSGGLNP